ncbi:toxin-antitoxin system YwqK family antitoxin [Aureispira anguillae]|uniref:Toxin-antitoxin system YwqK family antitoxin n=1 Tax=Aureispira anguillae TaxID=2864201 RepID=A0A915YIL7_9BACT|nr:toxin-antitoxin system YwqK family antitoxin [Aureispira anguillae]BDS13740.1 toxin-antitoxin system YwqK family antitoxin [Aureispira anguillae]
MKAIKIIAISSLFLLGVVACTSTADDQSDNTTTVDQNTAAPVVAIELEDTEQYSADSMVKIQHQIDKATGYKHGIYKEYDVPTGALMTERTYVQNKIEGLEKIYFANGQVDGEFTYKDGVHDGVFKYYYEDGTLKQQGSYKAGKMEGVLSSYYANGTLKEEVMHVDGLTQGVFKEYNENGSLKAEGGYTSKSDRENLEHGPLKLYDENGELIQKMVCKDGQCCTIWTLEDGAVKPSSKLCEAIINEHKS